MREELETIRRFHGHLGPNVIYGYRMGLIARPERHKDAHAKVYCGSSPPMSCLIDGIQLSSNCTMGKGNIEVAGDGELRAVFEYKDGRRLEIKVKDQIKERFLHGLNHDNEDERSSEIMELPDDVLFDRTVSNV